MRNVLFTLCAICTLASCRPSQALLELGRIEGIIQDEPQLALSDLNRIDIKDLRTPKERALHALLLSMALDKNYVDMKTDSLLLPAIRFYSHSSDKYHKFLCLYYQARIHENSDDFNGALNKYIEAEALVCDDIPRDYLVRLYNGKERIYGRQFARDRALEEVLKAAKISKDLPNPLFYIVNCLDITSIYYRMNEPDLAVASLDTLKVWIENRQIAFPSGYFEHRIKHMMYYENAITDSIETYFNRYLEACSEEQKTPNALFCVDVLTKTGKYEEANAIMKQLTLPPGCSPYDSISFLASSAEIYKGLKQYDDYIAVHAKCDSLTETITLNVFNSDIRFLEERHRNAIDKEKAKQRNTILILLSCALFAFLAYGSVYYTRKKKDYETALREINAEYSFFNELYGESDVPGDIKRLIQDQLKALSPYIIRVPNNRISRKEINALRINNQDFLKSIGLIYALSYPSFVSGLVKYRLTPEEIGLCSLYASGYISKEIQDVVSSSIYRTNTSIRNKLKDTLGKNTLPFWLREFFKSTTT